MTGWIIYNGHLKLDKITKLIENLLSLGKEVGLELKAIKNNEVVASIVEGSPKLHVKDEKARPDFVLFWDKDIRLCEVIENMGIPVFNSSHGIFACDNKMLMHNELSKHGIRVPKTIFAPFTYYTVELTDVFLETVKKELAYPLVLKEAYGSFGMQVHFIDDEQMLLDKVEELGYRPFLLQEYIEASRGRDVRMNIVGDEVVGAMERRSEVDFRANITLGGKGYHYQPRPSDIALALKAHHALGLHFSGVDLIFDQEGEAIVCEVNSNPNYLSTITYTNVNVGRHILNYIKERLA